MPKMSKLLLPYVPPQFSPCASRNWNLETYSIVLPALLPTLRYVETHIIGMCQTLEAKEIMDQK